MVKYLDETSSKYALEINAEKTKVMTNSTKPIQTKITVGGQQLEQVTQFKYLGAIISEGGSKTEVLARAAQTASALARLKPIWRDKNISTKTKIKLLRALVLTIFLYAWESWTSTADLQRKISAVEMRCFRRLLGISYKDHTTDEEVRNRVSQHIGQYEDLLTTVKKRKLKWYGHVTRAGGLAKTVLQGAVQGKRKRGGQKKQWADNIKEWTGMNFATTQALSHDRQRWRQMVRRSAVQRPHDQVRLRDQ